MSESCPTCGTALPAGAQRCPGCGRVFGEDNRCPHCHAIAAVRAVGDGYVCTACSKPRERKPLTTVLGETLWTELGPRGVDVLVCAPGATSTPNFERKTPAEKRAQAHPMTPEAVAEGALAHLTRGPLYIPGPLNRVAYGATKLLSRRAVTRFMSDGTRKLYAKDAP